MPEQIATATDVKFGEDFMAHRITGTVTHAPPGVDPWLEVPLVTHVRGNLYQGGCFGGIRLPDEFRTVVSLYPWEKYALGPNTKRKEIRMYDALGQDPTLVEQIAKTVQEALLLGPTLVHCQAGLNRSGLVAARVLMLEGLTADEAIGWLREQRSPLVLCNSAFEAYLRGLEA